MNAYAVCIPEERVAHSYEGPPEIGVPLDIFRAESPSQAKADALREWSQRLSSGVYSDDWPALRVRKIAGNVSGKRGAVKLSDPLWNLWPDGWPVVRREAVA